MTTESPVLKKLRLCLLVPTRNRLSDLTRLCESLRNQTRKPDGILIIDGSNPENTVEKIKNEFSELPLSYLRVYPPGLTKQRNAGLAHVKGQYELIGFLDDDLELYSDAIESMMSFWERSDSRVGGASFNIVNNEPSRATFLHRLFMISNKNGGTVLKSGSNVILHPVMKDSQAEWLCGGATIWRSHIFNEHQFEENYGGYGSLDDLDFSLRLKDKHKLFILKGPRVTHHSHPVRKEKQFEFAQYDTINRYQLVRNYGYSRLAFVWASIGRIIGYAARGIIYPKRRQGAYAIGIIVGLFKILGGVKKYTAQDVK